VLVHGSGQDAEALRVEIAGVLAGLGLRLSEAKTRVTHMSEGFSFLGTQGVMGTASVTSWQLLGPVAAAAV
jgi:RNA-directed DNA polymerase